MALDHFLGYPRADGRAGVRSHVLLLPLGPGANRAASLAAEQLPGAAQVQMHQDVRPDLDGYALAVRTLRGFVDHPNVYATVIVALSDDDALLQDVTRALPAHVRHAVVTLKSCGGTRRAAEAIVAAADPWLGQAAAEVRQPIPLAQLVLATECGGSDACSGLSANPALGYASDLLTAGGGTSILAETTELIGAEHILRARAVTPAVGERLMAAVGHAERASMRMGVDFRGGQPAPGNMEGGITTIEEKSLGCVHKGGTSPLVDVVDYAERPRTKGLVVMDTPGQDVMQLVGMAAGGAQLTVFTTGRGTPTGLSIAPVIKMSTRTALRQALPDLIDIDAGPIVDGHLTVEAVGEQLFRKIISVASGETVAAERLGHREFGIFQGWGEESR